MTTSKVALANAALLFGLLAGQAVGADFDYSNNEEFHRKYPDPACIDSVDPRSLAEEVEGLTADKLAQIGRSTSKVSVKRPGCHAEKRLGSTVSEQISGSEYLDRLYMRLSSGPIPHGFHQGRVVLSKDRGLRDIAALGVRLPGEESLESFAQKMWSGKFFDREKMFLKNRINLSGQSSTPPTSLTDPKMKFPAKLYCGQSLFDSRRESIIIDYKYGIQDRPEGVDTDAALDWLGGPKGLAIRDEIRMVKPGLYLGRAYMHGIFGLYFVLEYVEGTGTAPQANAPDACWVGTQRQRALGMRPSDFINHSQN